MDSLDRRPQPDSTAKQLFSLDGYMADANTRVFNYNGRKLVSILGKDSFPGERILKLPTKVVEFASRQPLTSALLPCRLGYFPNARGQKVSRPNGDWAFTLLFCLDGVGRLQLSRSDHRMTRGTFAVLRPFEFHAYQADEAHPWSYYWIHFNGTMAQQYYDVLTGAGKNTCVSVEPNISFVQSFEKILGILHEGHAHKLLVQASSVLHQLFGELYGMVCRNHAPQETTRERVERTIQVVRDNLGMHVSIQELAAIANMSQTHYAQQFRAHTGMTPRSYINRMKIDKACDYLGSTDAKIESVAQMVGYDDPFYFCRLFKRVTGKTPTAYRRAEQGRVVTAQSGAAAQSVSARRRIPS